VFAVRPVIELVKLPEPVPSDVWLAAISGLAAVDQQTPRTVMLPPPSAVILPPEAAVVAVMEEGVVVVRVGKATRVVN